LDTLGDIEVVGGVEDTGGATVEVSEEFLELKSSPNAFCSACFCCLAVSLTSALFSFAFLAEFDLKIVLLGADGVKRRGA